MAYHRVLDDLTPEQVAKLRALKQSSESMTLPASNFYTPHELLLAEFADYYGWQALRDAEEGRIEWRTFYGLLYAGRSLHLRRRIERMVDVFNATACAAAKDGAKILNRQLKDLERRA